MTIQWLIPILCRFVFAYFIYFWQIFDSAAKLWRKVIVDSVSARWVDLGTRLVLRHVVRVAGAEEGSVGEGVGGSNDEGNNQENRDDEHKPRGGDEGRGNQQSHERKQRGEGDSKGSVEKGTRPGSEADEKGGAAGRDAGSGAAATVEVDLSEIRWAEVTGGDDQRRAEARTKNLAGVCGFFLGVLCYGLAFVGCLR